jgi:hypothetical protein
MRPCFGGASRLVDALLALVYPQMYVPRFGGALTDALLAFVYP